MARRATKTTPAAVAYNDLVLCGQKMDVAYSVPAIQPAADGQWRVEPDKIAWTDPTTGYPCIIRRERGGHLGAYVGLHRQHPLYGYEADAIPRCRLRRARLRRTLRSQWRGEQVHLPRPSRCSA